VRRRRAAPSRRARFIQTSRNRIVMGKYLIAWILGVPAIVVVLAYLFFH
jgi:bacteriorhodopsin